VVMLLNNVQLPYLDLNGGCVIDSLGNINKFLNVSIQYVNEGHMILHVNFLRQPL
jgi:hypothetical protein